MGDSNTLDMSVSSTMWSPSAASRRSSSGSSSRDDTKRECAFRIDLHCVCVSERSVAGMGDFVSRVRIRRQIGP